MRYRVKGAGIIRSENAAKPAGQKSKFVVELLRNLGPVETSLDYGAGKLRYLDELQMTTQELIVADSTAQLDRLQKIQGEDQSIRQYCQHLNSLTVLSIKQLSVRTLFIDRAFLFNVLQIIPIPAVRGSVLKRIYRSLKPGGELIASVQYRNSDFTRMASMPNSKIFRDGFLIEHLRGTSFYGLIKPSLFEELIASKGFIITRIKLYEGSCYIWATKPT